MDDFRGGLHRSTSVTDREFSTSDRQRCINALTGLVCIVICLLMVVLIFARDAGAQNIEGQIIAAQYGQWQLPGTATNSFVFLPNQCQVSGGGVNIAVPQQGNLVRIVDPGNPALDETVVAGRVNINECSVQLTPANVHVPPFYLTSGTAGLQEAINANPAANQQNSVILNQQWYALGGSAEIIAGVHGSTLISLVDITTTPYTWYVWNGTKYSAVAASGTPGGSSGSLQYNAGGSFAGANLVGLIRGNGTSAPTSAVPGTDYQTPISNVCSGGISCSLVGSTYNFSSSGSTGAGNVNAAPQYSDGGYPSSGTTSTIGTQGNSATLPNGLTGAQMQSAISSQSATAVTHINGPNPPFQNHSNFPVQDDRPGVHTLSVTERGAACDTILTFGQVTAGSSTLTINPGFGYQFSASDADPTTPKWISMVGTVSGVPTRFDASIAAVTSGTVATLSANAPFTSVSNASITLGHPDDDGLETALANASQNTVVTLPAGSSVCWARSGPVALYGQSIRGQTPTLTGGALLGGAGFDTLATEDPSVSGFHPNSTSGQNLGYASIYVDARINAAEPWSFDNNGTTTSETPLYRPAGLMTPTANNPQGPGWVRGSEPYGLFAFLGVATTTASGAGICVLTPSVPPVGADIVFPQYGNGNVVHATVASTAGTCASGSPLTLTSGAGLSAVTQNSFFYGEAPSASASGTAVQEIETAIPATGRTFPMTVNLANTIHPEPGAESDFAPYGLVKIDGEEFTYYATSSYPIQAGSFIKLTAGAQNGTTAASHSAGAAIVPLNPCSGQSNSPWPVATINGSGNQTPAGAEFFPAWCVGNAALAQPVFNGADWTGTASFSGADIHNLQLLVWPISLANTAENPINFQASNSTAGIWIQALPFSSKFENLRITNTQFGIFEGGPSINTSNYWGGPEAPTTDKNEWSHITIQSSGYDTDWISDGTPLYSDIQLFSSNGPPATGWPGFAPAFTGAGTAGFWSAAFTDDTSGLGLGQYTTASGCHNAFVHSVYLEAEAPGSGGLEDTQPLWVFDCNRSTWSGQGDISGGPDFIDGFENYLSGSLFNNVWNLPAVINGFNTRIDNVNGLSNSNNSTIGNVWGENSLIVYVQNVQVSSLPGYSISGSQRLSYGGTATVAGQTNEFALTGNWSSPAVNSQDGFFPAITLNPAGAAGSAIGWTFDGTAANMTQSYEGCVVGTGVTTVECTLFLNGNTQQGPGIGPGQLLAAAPYIATIGVRESSGSAQTFGMYFQNSCTGFIDTTHTAVPVTTTWTNVPVGVINLGGSSGCALTATVNGTSASATGLEFSYLSMAPQPQSISLPVNTPTEGAACSEPPGSIIGSDASFIYICASGGTVKRAAIN
jgi:hypothetical protein